MKRPPELDADSRAGGPSGEDVWSVLRAAHGGDIATLRACIERAPELNDAEFEGTGPLHLAVRGGHADAVDVLVAAGADVFKRSGRGDDLVQTALDRGHVEIARSLESARAKHGPRGPYSEHPVHAAAEKNDVPALESALARDPDLVNLRDAKGGTPLHRAAAAGATGSIETLVAHGADVAARHGDGRADERGYAPVDFEPVDMALWSTPFWNVRGDCETARLLVRLGATRDVVIAAALGDEARVLELLDRDPKRVDGRRPSGKGALSAAVEFGHGRIVEALLDRGARVDLREGPAAPRGSALHAAARRGDAPLVELLLAHGADPNSFIDSSGSATFAARTPELRNRLYAAGGRLDPFDLVWLGEDERALQAVVGRPDTAAAGCGTVFAAVCKLEKRELLRKLLDAGARVPQEVNGCRSYLLEQPDMLAALLASGMDPDLPDWQGASLLHELCARDLRGRPRPARVASAEVLLKAGANPRARDDEYRSTPMAWAARSGLGDMVELLLAHGLPPREHDDEEWAAPLAWAERRGHEELAARLRAADSGG